MLKDIKHRFTAYRNGIIADTLRKAGYPHKVIFGLQLPQLKQIADEVRERCAGDETPAERSAQIAEALWQDADVRESRLLATYLMDPRTLSPEECLRLAEEARTQEEADMLAFRVLRHRADAPRLLPRLPESTRKALSRFL